MGDLLGQANLTFTGEEEADRPRAGVVGRATLRVIVHLIGDGQSRGMDRAGCSGQSAATATGYPEHQSASVGACVIPVY